MSFRKASAILRGKWLINQEWADAHLPLVISFMKGDAAAGAMLMGKANYFDTRAESDGGSCDDVELVDGTKNVYEVSCGCDLNKVPFGSIAYVDIDGPMFKTGDDCSDGMEDYAELMDALRTATNVAGVIIDIDSPGGEVDGTATFGDSIRKLSSFKPTIGIIDDGMSASAAYWAISACNEVYCTQPTSQAGSIGVYCKLKDMDAYFRSQGLPVIEVYAPQSTDKNAEIREALDGNDAKLKEELAFICDVFISTVNQNRKGKIRPNSDKGLNTWSTGKLYFAADAVKEGLVDGIKSFDQVVFRMSRLISSSKNSSNIMAFEKTLAVAGATELAVTDDGFVLSEEQLNLVEAALNDHASNATALEQANSMIQDLQGEITGYKANDQGEIIANQAARITALEAEVAELGGKPSGGGTPLVVTEDVIVAETKPEKITLNHPDHPVNVEARKHLQFKNRKK